MIGTKFYKNDYDSTAYAQAARWCNETQEGTIEDKGDYYEVVPIPAPALEEVKEQKIIELKRERDTRELLPIECNGHNFDFDQKSYERITAAIYALDLSGGTIAWTTADNDTVTVSANDLRGVIACAAVRSNQLHVKYRQLRGQVDSALTNEDVESVVWTD